MVFVAFRVLLLVGLATAVACGAELPADIEGYAVDCVRMTGKPIEPYDDDPHLGTKHVYACNVDRAAVEANTLPFPVGAIIVKESTRGDEPAPWLIATARRREDGWHWAEYTRNFPDEAFRRIPVGQDTCIDCHGDGQARDPIFTRYTAR